MTIAEQIKIITSSLPTTTRLIAVSKTKPVEDIQEAYNAGQRVFGENKALEMRDKHEALPKDIEWHFIGHLQTNKIKYIIPYVSLIHSIDSLNLLKEVNKEATKKGRKVDCLLQFHIAQEDTKFGLSYEEAEQLLSSTEYKQMENIRIVGVMGMATFTDNNTQVSAEFGSLRTIFDRLKKEYFSAEESFCELSMGMSDDYHLAIEQGSTLVRVGSAIFGKRNYNIPVND
ncbi:MAG: YggS family pyridoxal phosphate-dependent enzyme [Bacteroidales bacterium]|nr:YggS family pyridoxal phosphate-dependent enzyme [Bacteroidales bacterium]